MGLKVSKRCRTALPQNKIGVFVGLEVVTSKMVLASRKNPLPWFFSIGQEEAHATDIGSYDKLQIVACEIE